MALQSRALRRVTPSQTDEPLDRTKGTDPDTFDAALRPAPLEVSGNPLETSPRQWPTTNDRRRTSSRGPKRRATSEPHHFHRAGSKAARAGCVTAGPDSSQGSETRGRAIQVHPTDGFGRHPAKDASSASQQGDAPDQGDNGGRCANLRNTPH